MFNLKKLLIIILTALIIMPNSVCYARRRRGGRIGKKISFVTKDGIVINGLYQKPSSARRKVFILLHGLGSNQEEWQGFIKRLIKYGNGFLSYDARGHGNSTQKEDGQTINYQNFGASGQNTHWEKMVSDLEEAVKYLETKRAIRENRIGLIGASLGANVCLIYASKNEKIMPVVLLSPGLNYAGLDTREAISAFKISEENKKGRPLAIVSSPNDTYAYQSSYLLYNQVKANKRVLFVQGNNSSHGVQMLNKSISYKIVNWIQRY
ncbi:MAG: alpha/beta fold hydrolase [Endomicrobiales bacterium]|nr:alpha/beta fold hydrolase [Endomicrobiales bacterium]